MCGLSPVRDSDTFLERSDAFEQKGVTRLRTEKPSLVVAAEDPLDGGDGHFLQHVGPLMDTCVLKFLCGSADWI